MVDATTAAGATATHLEKMGRELKCPICLSLLNSSVSLTCNHVFCNLCLTKSMKTDSHCPVCKVPYRPREIRPAPHMDNLVSIYKNMEVASGVTIHVTQNAPISKTSDEKCQLEALDNVDKSNTRGFSHGKPTKQRKQKKKGPKESGERNKGTPDSQLSAKPSFPAKKRVHVPECIHSETPTRTTKHEGRGKNAEKGLLEDSNVLKEKPSFTASGEPVLSPFFWLRDRTESQMERLSSQTTEMDHIADTPQEIYNFSDIKESDIGSPVEMTGNGKDDTQFKTANAFDSEMFEWTQRPCSPELSSTSVKEKVACKNKMARIQGNNEVGSKFVTVHSREKPDSESIKQGNGSKESKSLSSQTAKVVNKSSKSGKSGKSKRKQDKLFVDKTNGDVNATSASDDADPNMKNTMQKKKTKETVDNEASNKTMIKSLQCSEAKIQNQCNENINKSTDFAREKLVSAENQKDDYTTYLNENVVSMEIDSQDKRKCQSNLRGRKRLRISKDYTVKSELVGGILKGCSKTQEQKNQKFTGLSKDNQNMVIDNAQTSNEVLSATKDKKLGKCESTLGHICCAFCHSSKDSKACGKMMHYSNGRPVASDYNGGSTIIHAHKDCAVWAPNVYFDNEIAFNLESELARSRRIKCSCCGLKGAALGCYEKSCRKSFHVPCAKSMPQCRWDAENFVMLCPLHSSSNLPIDLSGSQGKKMKKNTLERKSHDHQAEATVRHDVSATPSWRGSSNKLVLCCSGLNDAEKETVSKFTKMAGVSLLKTYGSTVTHIIASTDENGSCRRTLKILLGILDGKWILKIDWIKACIEALEPVSEEEYEIGVDIHGIRDGPRLGRLRVQNKQPKLFKGCNFYFMSDFVSSYKGYLQDMVVAAGGTVLHRKPISGELCGLSCESTFIIYNAEECDSGRTPVCGRRAEAEALANSNGAKVAGHWWVLDSIAACKLQPF